MSGYRTTVAFEIPGWDFEVPVVIEPALEHAGVLDYRAPYMRPAIYLREWNERVLLHETLHAFLHADPARTVVPASAEEERLVRHLTHLYELGWRFVSEHPGSSAAHHDPARATPEEHVSSSFSVGGGGQVSA